jgi:hypothetical protein
MAELGEVARAEVGQLVLFPVAPDVFQRIEFRRVGGQVCELDPTPLPGDILSDQPAAMGFGRAPVSGVLRQREADLAHRGAVESLWTQNPARTALSLLD